ncbi:hypothetical protein TKK_0000161 [Trichogramma kaykai]
MMNALFDKNYFARRVDHLEELSVYLRSSINLVKILQRCQALVVCDLQIGLGLDQPVPGDIATSYHTTFRSTPCWMNCTMTLTDSAAHAAWKCMKPVASAA